MQRPSFFKTILVVSLGAFLLLGVLSALPHTHPNGAHPAPHDCLVCRAQSAQPHVEPPSSAPAPVRFLEGSSVGKIPLLFSQDAQRFFASRAPPVVPA